MLKGTMQYLAEEIGTPLQGDVMNGPEGFLRFARDFFHIEDEVQVRIRRVTCGCGCGTESVALSLNGEVSLVPLQHVEHVADQYEQVAKVTGRTQFADLAQGMRLMAAMPDSATTKH